MNASAESLGATALVVLTFGLVDTHADEVATEKANALIAPQIAVGRGVTVTYSPITEQRDTILGLLPRGVVPARPYKEPVRFLLNERWQLRAGGRTMQIAGPFSGGESVWVDIRVERGDLPSVNVECEDSVVRRFNGTGSGKPPLTVTGTRLQTRFGTRRLAVPSCPRWFLSVHSKKASTIAVRMRPDRLE